MSKSTLKAFRSVAHAPMGELEPYIYERHGDSPATRESIAQTALVLLNEGKRGPREGALWKSLLRWLGESEPVGLDGVTAEVVSTLISYLPVPTLSVESTWPRIESPFHWSSHCGPGTGLHVTAGGVTRCYTGGAFAPPSKKGKRPSPRGLTVDYSDEGQENPVAEAWKGFAFQPQAQLVPSAAGPLLGVTYNGGYRFFPARQALPGEEGLLTCYSPRLDDVSAQRAYLATLAGPKSVSCRDGSQIMTGVINGWKIVWHDLGHLVILLYAPFPLHTPGGWLVPVGLLDLVTIGPAMPHTLSAYSARGPADGSEN